MVNTVEIERMYQEMLSRIPAFERAKKVIETHIDILQKSGGLFTFAPVVDGSPGYLAAATEERCCKAVIRELNKCKKEIDEHLERINEISKSQGPAPTATR